MGKQFLEVFPDLHMTSEMEELMKLVEVERVSAARDRTALRVYIVSPRLIHKQDRQRLILKVYMGEPLLMDRQLPYH